MRNFYFIRHGETDWNKKQIPMGQTDIPLNTKGIQQSLYAQDLLSHIPFRSIISSPLRRAEQTATIIAEKQSCPVITNIDLKEASWGILEGKKQQNSDWLQNWLNGTQIENGETFTQLQARVKKALEQIYTAKEPCLVVSHGAVYWAIQKLLDLDFIDISNCEPMYHIAPALSQNGWQRTLKYKN